MAEKRKYWILLSIILLLGICNKEALSQSPSSKAFWLDKLARIEMGDNQIALKKASLEKLLASYENYFTEKDSTYARMVHRLGDFYTQSGDLEKGIYYTQLAVSINASNQPFSEKAYLSHSYFNLGLNYSLLNQFTESLQYFDSAIAIAVLYPEKQFISALAHEQKAFYYFSIGEYQRSQEISDYGLLKTNELQGTAYEALLLIQKAQSQLELDLLGQAEENIQRALEILNDPEIPRDLLAVGYSVYAFLLDKKDDPNGSVSYLKKAYKINMMENKYSQAVKDLSDLGLLYHTNFYDYEMALTCYFQCVDLLQDLKDQYQLALVYNNIGELYLDQHDNINALLFFQKGLEELSTAATDTLGKSKSITPQAVDNDQILTTLLSNKGAAMLEIYKHEKKSDYLNQALRTFKEADKAIDQMRWNQHTIQSKLYWREKTKNNYEQAIEVCYLLNDLESGFYFFEKSRAVLLSDKLSELGANKLLSPEDQEREKKLQLQLHFLNQKLTKMVESDKEYQQTRLKWFNAQDTYERFIKSLEHKYPAYYQYKYDTINPTITEVREKVLKDDQTLIEYFQGDSAIYMMAVMKDTSVFIKSNYKDYRTAAHELLTLSSNKLLLNQSYNRYQNLAYEIYEHLFKPLSIRTKKVIISPDDHFVPFEILLTDPDNPRSFLLRDHAFSYTYSADYLIQHFQEQSIPANPFLGVAPVNYHPSLQQQSLLGADLSLKKIQSDFQSKKLLINESATKRQFLHNLPFYSILHLYSHANADSIGTEPVFYLQDSLIRVSELSALGSLSTRLIILAACNTGIGKNIQGEGIFSLARGFAAAGVPSSITTLWPIDTQPTYQLSEILLKYISQGLPLDEALQKAKLDFLDNNDITFELPFYWAASILIGKTDQISPIKKGNTFGYLLAGTAIFILIISALIYFSRKNYFKSSL